MLGMVSAAVAVDKLKPLNSVRSLRYVIDWGSMHPVGPSIEVVSSVGKYAWVK